MNTKAKMPKKSSSRKFTKVSAKCRLDDNKKKIVKSGLKLAGFKIKPLISVSLAKSFQDKEAYLRKELRKLKNCAENAYQGPECVMTNEIFHNLISQFQIFAGKHEIQS